MNLKSGDDQPDSLYHQIEPDGEYSPNTREQKVEQHILKFSVYAALFFAVLGIVWGIAIRSQMIIFDGAYSFISVVLASLSIYVSKSIQRGDDIRFPFGRSQMEPMVIVLKSLVLIVICGNALFMGATSLFTGGREVNALSAMGYAAVGTFGCLGGWFYIYVKRKKAQMSGLAKAEGMQWFLDMILSASVMVGFFIAYLMENFGYGELAKYVDPVMIIIATLYFIRMPILSIISGIREMLLMAPEDGVYSKSKEALSEIAKKRGFHGLILRIGRGGPELMYEIGFVTYNPKDTRSIGELDDIRQEAEDRLNELFENPKWLSIEFMHNKKWG